MHFLDDFRYARWMRNANLSFQILLSFSLLIGVNYLAFKNYSRMDLTRKKAFSLAPETVAHLRQINKPVKIIVTLQKNGSSEAAKRIYSDVSLLLKEFLYATRKDAQHQLDVEFVNVFQQHKRAEELAKLYNVQGDTAMLVVCGEKHRAIFGSDLYDGKTSTFKGEQAFTSAILDVTADEIKKIYCVQGHGELIPTNTDPVRGFSAAAQLFAHRNIFIDTIDLLKNNIPDDASLLIIASPQVSFLKQEEEKLRRYLSEKNGRIIVFLDAEKEHGLDDLFFDWAIRTNGYTIFDTGNDFVSASGDYVIRRFSKHPITQLLIDSQFTLLMGFPRPVYIDAGAVPDDKRKVSQLVFTSESSFCQKIAIVQSNPKAIEPVYQGIQSIAVCSERSTLSQLGLNIPGGRIVVFGNADFVTNNRLNVFGNTIILLNTVNWCLNCENLLNIPPRVSQNFHLNITRNEFMWIIISFIIIPAIVAMAGLLIMIFRKSN